MSGTAPGRIQAKASQEHTVRLHEVRFKAQRRLGFLRALMGHLARSMVTILHEVRDTPEEVRWLISKYGLKRIKKRCV